MPITYEKLIEIFKDKGITSYTFRQNKVIGQATWKKIQNGGDIDTRTIANLCEFLGCQPGDILEYIPYEPAPKGAEQEGTGSSNE